MTLKIIVALAVLTLVLILLFLTNRRTQKPHQTRGRQGKPTSFDNEPAPEPLDAEQQRPCPLCHEMLNRGERIMSVVYTRGTDKTMHIFGCRYCYENHPDFQRSKKQERRCPRCGKPLTGEDHLSARVFEKGRKSHVHVLGCPRCRAIR